MCVIVLSHSVVSDSVNLWTDCSPPGSSVHGILQAGILEWIATSSSRGSSLAQGSNSYLLSLLHCRRILYH